MKKNLLLLLLLAAVAFTGCKKDKIDDNPQKAIVGKWSVEKEVEKEYEDGRLVSEETDTDFGSSDYLEFKSDGTGIQSYANDGDDPYTTSFTYKIVGTKLQLIFDFGNGDEYAEELEIKKLNSNKLILYGEDIDTEEGDPVTYKETWEITLKK